MAESESQSGDHFFEGVEKLLEIWFTRSDGNTMQCDLRNIPRQKFEGLLKIVKCEVMSFMHNDQVDAYVLSESSMFVSHRRFILKTCGSTTPLHCLKSLLLLVEQYTGFDEVEDVFYSRKNFKRPELQSATHQVFEKEVKVLNAFFEDGKGYRLGMKTTDCWYLYALNPVGRTNSKQHSEPDQTIEILMSDLNRKVMNIFTQEESISAAEATQKSGIAKLLPNMVIDDYLFQPCGYSMNGISKSGHYMTIHITPEPDFSYVSFECNVPKTSYKDLISQVLETFQPGKFIVTVFANKSSVASDIPKKMEKLTSFGDWLRHDVQYCSLKNYDLIYAFYSKFPS